MKSRWHTTPPTTTSVPHGAGDLKSVVDYRLTDQSSGTNHGSSDRPDAAYNAPYVQEADR
jgi:hypothetical protein